MICPNCNSDNVAPSGDRLDCLSCGYVWSRQTDTSKCLRCQHIDSIYGEMEVCREAIEANRDDSYVHYELTNELIDLEEEIGRWSSDPCECKARPTVAQSTGLEGGK